MNFAFFIHSAVSDWNHGNAHFLRGLMSALVREGHGVRSYEARRSWSVDNLLAEQGPAPIVEFARAYPEIEVHVYRDPAAGESLPGETTGEAMGEIEEAAVWADVVLVHEWSSPALVQAIGRLRSERRDFVALFHDSHHRAWSSPAAVELFHLAPFDGVLAFGRVIRDLYRRRFGAANAWTFHEAADVERFRPLESEKTQDVVWIGNWGDEERGEELQRYWLESALSLAKLRFIAHGVRYPEAARAALAAAGVEFRGWASSLRVPEILAASRVTLHVPRRAYTRALPGIPTIRVFEALACGIPLVSTPWPDVEGLFRPGDYRVAHTPGEMGSALHELATDHSAAQEQAARGLETILARHTCRHRAAELLDIVAELGRAGGAGAPLPRSSPPTARNAEARCA